MLALGQGCSVDRQMTAGEGIPLKEQAKMLVHERHERKPVATNRGRVSTRYRYSPHTSRTSTAPRPWIIWGPDHPGVRK
jgi:hypothetical protein